MQCQQINEMDTIDRNILGFIYVELTKSNYLRTSSLDFLIGKATDVLNGKYRQHRKE